MSPGRRGFFSRHDWAAFWASFLCVEAVYAFTLAPTVTLEDSGELITAAVHLGVPHPPGYPFWTLVNWLFIHLFPVGHIAWRANLCSSLFGALACGVVALITSFLAASLCRIPSIGDGLPDDLRRWIPPTAGVLAGTSLGFLESLWFQSVITEVYSLNIFVFALILLFLLRSSLAPERLRWLALAFFFFGVGLTIHQSVVLFAPALLLFIALTHRATLLGLLPYVLTAATTISLSMDNRFAAAITFVIFVVFCVMHVRTRPPLHGTSPLVSVALALVLPSLASFLASECLNDFAALAGPVDLLSLGLALPLLLAVLGLQLLLSLAGSGAGGRRALALILAGAAGLAFYAYLPLAAWTNPPVNWSYTGTVAGFVHSITRGGYGGLPEERTLGQFVGQLSVWCADLADNYTVPAVLLALAGLVGLGRLRGAERKYAMLLVAAYVGLGLFLVYVLNSTFEEHILFINRVFYLMSYTIVSIWVGLGGVLLVAQLNRVTGMVPWGIALGLAAGLAGLAVAFERAWSFQAVLLAALIGLCTLIWCCLRLPALRYGACLALLLVPAGILAHNAWPNSRRPWGSEQRGHDFGWMYGHDMLDDLDRSAVVLGGTDAGRFVSTYMIFVESVADPRTRYFKDRDFDRRDLYIITQNYLWDPTYLAYIRDQYSDERPSSYNRFERWLGRDRSYPDETLALPDEEHQSRIRARVEQELETQAPSGVLVPHISGVERTFAINAAMAREIFEANKDRHAFYVEESIPLAWMDPYLEPHGLILKLNPEPLDRLGDESVSRDMAYWQDYTERLLSNPKFLRDIVARRAFAKLRSTIGTLYERRGRMREAEIALRQTVELFGGSPEACSSLIRIYLGQERYAEARAIARTWLAHDPGQVAAAEMLARIDALAHIGSSEPPPSMQEPH